VTLFKSLYVKYLHCCCNFCDACIIYV